MFFLPGGGRQLAQQRGAGAVWIGAFETVDQCGRLGRDGALLSAIVWRKNLKAQLRGLG